MRRGMVDLLSPSLLRPATPTLEKIDVQISVQGDLIMVEFPIPVEKFLLSPSSAERFAEKLRAVAESATAREAS